MLRTITPRILLLLPGLMGLAGCLEDVVQPVPVAWEGDLFSIGGVPTQVAGSVAALSQGSRARASIQITDAEPDTTYEWLVRRGTCGAPSSAIVGGRASYPPLTASASGAASADALLPEAMLSGSEFHGALFAAGESEPFACADLHQV